MAIRKKGEKKEKTKEKKKDERSSLFASTYLES
jgi:hypothetical protein